MTAVLTPRKLEILALVRRGYTAEEIAAELSISPSGVKQQLAKLREIAGVERTRQLITWDPT